MGLFDSYFDQNAYQDGGGLFGRLFSSLAMQGQYQPGAGFPQSPMDATAAAPAAAPVQQNAPIAIGDYSMPRLGGGFSDQLAAVKQGAPLPKQSAAELSAGVLPGSAPSAQPDFAALLQPRQSAGGLMGGMQGALANLHNGPIGLIAGGLAGAMGMGQGTPAQQEARSRAAQYQALVAAGIPKEKALVATLNPEAGKTILADAFGAKGFQFATLPDGTVLAKDPKTGAVLPVYHATPKADFGIVGESDGSKNYGFIDRNRRTVQPVDVGGGEANGGTITGPGGKPIEIPAGVDRGTFRKEVSKSSADAAMGKMTETQAKASSFAARMELAEKALRPLEGEGTSYVGRGLDALPLIGGTGATNSLHSADYQKYRQAASAYITAMLRQESGAAISKEEFARYEREMMPQPGDSPEVLTQKRAARWAAIEQMRKAAGPGYTSPVLPAGAVSHPGGSSTTKTGVQWSVVQ